jgi:anti-anti-sigma regulatory factor
MATALGSGDDRADLLCGFYEDATRGVTGDRDDITMLLLEHTAGASHFDDAAPPEQRPQTETAATQSPLLQGTMDGKAFISVTGSITWLCSQALLDCANRLLQQQDRLILDLSACEHMDSTCLGTLHEIVASKPDAVLLQGVSDGVRKLFDELSMTRVLDHISPDRHPLPQHMTPLDGAELSPQQQGARILSAHEVLSALSEDNREQFQAVVDSMRADLHRED